VEGSTETSTIHETDKKKYLTFILANEKYSIPLSQVREILSIADVTPIPRVPKYIRGLINLRGKIISVLDVKAKLNLPIPKEQSKNSSIIIVEINGFILGMIVDDVTEVMALSDDQLDRADGNHNTSINGKYIDSIARIGDQQLILNLNISEVLSMQEIEILKQKIKK